MDLHKRIDEFQALQKGWNGYGAPPIPESVISRSRRFANKLDREAEVFPTGRESVQFEFDNIEVEIFESSVEVLKDSTPSDGYTEFSLDDIDEAIERYGGA